MMVVRCWFLTEDITNLSSSATEKLSGQVWEHVTSAMELVLGQQGQRQYLATETNPTQTDELPSSCGSVNINQHSPPSKPGQSAPATGPANRGRQQMPMSWWAVSTSAALVPRRRILEAISTHTSADDY